MYNPVTPTPLVPAHVVEAAPAESIGLRRLVHLLREAAWSILICAAILALAATIYALRTAPIYSATVKVLIDPGTANAFVSEGSHAELLFNEARIDSQVEVVKSERIASTVVRELRLIDDPEFAEREPSLLRQLSLWIGGPDEALSLDDQEAVRTRYANAVMANRMIVRRVGRSFVLEIGFLSADPERAAAIANAIAEVYIREQVRSKSDMALQGSAWLEERLAPLRSQAYEAMRAVERFKAVGGSGPVGESQVELAELQSVSDVYRRVYEIYLQKFTETAQRISFPVPDARIVSAAAAPLYPTHPKKTLIVGFAAAFGAVLGAVVHMFQRAFDRRIRSPRQIADEVGLDCLGAVSLIQQPGQNFLARVLGQQTSRHPPLLPIPLGLRSISSDLRSLKAALNAALPGDRSRCIGLVAATSGEGVTTLATGLACHYAAAGARVLLVDANHVDPALSHALAEGASFGLMDVLAAPGLLAGAVVEQEEPGLFVLPLGTQTGPATPGDRISTNRDALKASEDGPQFDLILFDLPALEASPDAREIARFLDGIVLVAAQPVTTIDGLTEAAASLEAARASVLGVVINKLKSKAGPEWLR